MSGFTPATLLPAARVYYVYMARRRIIITAALVLFLIIFGGVLYFLGDKHGVESMTFKRTDPTPLANAMKNDNFYTSYRDNTLLVTGTTKSVSQTAKGIQVVFKTNSSYSVTCNFGSKNPGLRANQTVTVLAQGGSAERQPAGVLLTVCTIPYTQL